MQTLSSLATEFVRFHVTATLADGTTLDLSNDTVQMAFVPVGQKPATGDWRTATWVEPNVTGLLVGPDGGTVLAVGAYDVWLQVLDSTEHPTAKYDTLRIT